MLGLAIVTIILTVFPFAPAQNNTNITNVNHDNQIIVALLAMSKPTFASYFTFATMGPAIPVAIQDAYSQVPNFLPNHNLTFILQASECNGGVCQ
jgi:hypothetical protein